MAKKLYSTKDRDASHRALEYARGRIPDGPDKEFPGTEVLAGLNHPNAHCREDPNGPEYSVWDDAGDITPVPSVAPPPAAGGAVTLDEKSIEAVADALMKRLAINAAAK